MNDSGETPVKERKSLLRKIFSQAEPAPSRKPAEQAGWRAQADVVAEGPPPVEMASPVEMLPLVEAPVMEAPVMEAPAPLAPPPDRPASTEIADAPRADPVETTGDEPAPVVSEYFPGQVPPAERSPVAPSPAEPLPAEPARPEPARSWWQRLRGGLARSSSSIGTGISDIFTKRKLDGTMLEELEDVLIRADLGVATATRIGEAVGKGRYDRDVSPDAVRQILATEVERVLAPCALPLEIGAQRPFVVLVVGVNGSGKTTTIGKLAARLSAEGHRVMLAAGDTFRAAAVAQLKIWGERLGCAVVAREQGSDAAGLAFAAIEEARAASADVLLMDTAGRLQNRTELMAELEKIVRVMRKLDAAAPHAVLLVLDATVGQNAMSQVEIFGKVAGVTGLVMTKLDGTARGGILVAIAEKFRLPVHFIGVGEGADDLAPFAARDFAEAIAGIDAPARP